MTEYTPEELDKMRDEAMIARIRREYVRVVIKTTKLTFNVDGQLIDEWKRILTERGDPFTMTDMRNGELLYDSEDEHGERYTKKV